ncbi:AMP-binding domain-containing protein [Mycobacteroides abscessus subsp. abscessus]|nr:AMP-binding domain-containing protein [Mycobacteroides abscessus subsp. abscessus]
MKQHSITVFCSTPSVVINLLPIMSRHKLNNLRLIVLSGECLNQAQLKIIKSNIPEVALWNAYGLTEASPRVSCNKQILDASCVGLPLSNLHVKIVNDKGEPCTDGELGELMVSGANVMKGYFNDPIQTSKKMKDGWLYTSDKAMLKDGRLYVVGRKDEMIIRSGMNIFPNEIEGYLVNHPNVKEAIVFGKKDVKIGERIYAWVVLNNRLLKTKPSDLFQYFIDEGIDSLAWPNVIEIKEDLPKTLTGKVSRNWEETK